jgi:hypothetical protein
MEIEKAVSIFEENKKKFNIPDTANLNSIEKRIIEYTSDSQNPALVKNVLVWVAQYYLPEKCRLYELTIDMDGEVIRFE